jgi:2-polyprenyl-3-methyl-5-hydroxy-6-metoxy-1,4-benzoquinol methylase
MTCLLCSGPTEPWLRIPFDWRKPGSTESFELRSCPACDFGQLEPRPTPERVASFYEVDYYTHADATAERELPFLDKLRRHLAWRFDRGSEVGEVLDRLSPGQSICEFGCGNGGQLARLKAFGHRVVGIEPDPKALEQARAKGVEAYPGTGESPPANLGRFDVVILNHVLEHCLDPRKVLEHALGMLEEDGRIFVEVPNQGSEGAAAAGSAWFNLDVPRHLNFFTRKSLEKLCAQAGLRVSEVQYHGYTRQFDNRWIESQQRIARAFGRGAVAPKLGAWTLLARTLLAPADTKYDSVRFALRRARSAAVSGVHPVDAARRPLVA